MVARAEAQQTPQVLVAGLKNPESVVINEQGQMFVSVIGERDRDGDGAIVKIDGGKVVPFAAGLDDPKGLVALHRQLFVADKKRVWRIDESGKAEVFAPASSFPTPPFSLNDLDVDLESGDLYVSDSGDRQGEHGAVYRITQQGVVSLVLDKGRFPGLHTPNGVLLDGAHHLLVADFGTGRLHRIKLADSSVETIAEGLGAADGLAWDQFGRLFVSDWRGGRVFAIARPGDKPVLLAQGFTNAADLIVDPATPRLLIPDMGGGTVSTMSTSIPGSEVDDRPLALQTAVAFPDLKWAGWQGETDDGRIHTLRPIVLTHAGDGSNRVFVATQHGVIHVFPNDQKATSTIVFLDIQDRVTYKDETNEEGFLGLAFHPRFKENGYFFVFYTSKAERLTNIVSRFQVRKDDPNRADPASEVEILRFKKPYWNHDGGTIIFGPDGFLYVTHGDGGARRRPSREWSESRDPARQGPPDRRRPSRGWQELRDSQGQSLPSTAPAPVPRSGSTASATSGAWPSTARPGGSGRAMSARTSGRRSTSSPRGAITAGTSARGCTHSEPRGSALGRELIDPIWEYYHHETGKSITGGTVYRGPRLPELDGDYLYADYVTGRFWALRYDEARHRVVENRPIASRGLPVMSFGEDEQGEVYFLTTTVTGQGIYWFSKR